ncbi:MAG: hypothetical protein ACHQF0_02620 [Chitinophagales bacterium]
MAQLNSRKILKIVLIAFGLFIVLLIAGNIRFGQDKHRKGVEEEKKKFKERHDSMINRIDTDKDSISTTKFKN